MWTPFKMAVLSFLRSRWTTLGLLLLLSIVVAIEGTWGGHLHSSPFFIALVALLIFSMAISVFDGCHKPFHWHALLSHIGLGIVLLSAILGSPFVESGKVVLYEGQPTRIAYTDEGRPMALPFEAEWTDFHIDYYADSVSPKQFTSVFQLRSLLSSDTLSLTTSVNHPAYCQGYRFYQDSYDRQLQRYTVIKVVKNPLLIFVWIGIAMLAMGAVLTIVRQWKLSISLPITLLIAAVFAVISIEKINFGTLMPALRSYWFVPHLIVYMLAYSLLAISLILFFITHFSDCPRLSTAAQRLLHTASSLLILGMLCGAVWAQQAWGDYWTWDPKECWAAATWLLTLAATHLCSTDRRGNYVRTICVLLAFLAMQITWYGVNYLPSAKNSLHTYNQQ